MKHKLLLLFALLLTALAASAGNVIYYTSTDGKVVIPYKTDDFGVNVVSNIYEGGQGKIVFDGVVQKIGEYAFFGCYSLTSIVIDNSVTEIGDYAFSDCSNLSAVEIPNSVVKIGGYAFRNCFSLTSVGIPNSVSTIGGWAFKGCTNLLSVEIPNSVTEIGKDVFYNCHKLKSVLLTDGLTEAKARKLYSWGEITLVKESTIPKFDPKALPILNISDISFTDNGNRRIDAAEKCAIKLKVSNTGKGAATGCVAKVNVSGAEGVNAKDVKIPTIAPGQTVEVSIDILADADIQDGSAQISVSVDEPNGFGCDPTLLTVETKAFETPKVLIADYSVTGASGGTLARKMPFDLQILLQNASSGTADDVTLSISVPQNVFLMDGDENSHFAKLDGGETKSMVYSLIVNNNYSAETIPVKFTLKEKYGKYAESRTINLTLNQSLSQNKIEIKGETGAQRANIELAKIQGGTKQSDVDLSIPQNDAENKNTFAVVIANENYKKETQVRFAANDGNSLRQYLTKTLGLPENNVHVTTDATLNEMRDQLVWLRQVAKAYKGEASIIFYYAGHGMPDEQSGNAYLIPTDGNSANPSSCLSLSSIYDELSQMPSRSTTVFLDACFSGAQRGEGMLMAARGVAIKAKAAAPKGNMVVFSAAQGTETAYPYTEQGHGLFTYFLLKKLQETNGGATLGELGEYILDNVSRTSIVVNGKSQTPSVSTALPEWRSLRLK